MNFIKSYFLGIKAQKARQKSLACERETFNYEQASSIGLLFRVANGNGEHQYINQFVQGLKRDGKKVETLTFFDRTEDSPYDFPFNFFTEKDISNFGVFTSSKIHNFIEKKFDYLFCINLDEFEPFDLILSASKAKCRIGKYDEQRAQLFELMIQVEGNSIKQLIEQIQHYTKAICFNH
ncbi:hypothetical protein AAG747_14920 [Rapidithrix thailandica]|uniref:Uncharacterized protein n=1 Tax=Rapidithrix thailandica TaxID=413964 RepID=A0AAW9SA52_9BACT